MAVGALGLLLPGAVLIRMGGASGVVGHLADRALTGAATGVIVDRPLSTFMAGLLVLVLSGPVAALLAVTVIGIAALPVLLAAQFDRHTSYPTAPQPSGEFAQRHRYQAPI